MAPTFLKKEIQLLNTQRKRRAKLLTPELQDECLDLLINGAGVREMASALNVSIASIYLTLDASPEFAKEWDRIINQVRFEVEIDITELATGRAVETVRAPLMDENKRPLHIYPDGSVAHDPTCKLPPVMYVMRQTTFPPDMAAINKYLSIWGEPKHNQPQQLAIQVLGSGAGDDSDQMKKAFLDRVLELKGEAKPALLTNDPGTPTDPEPDTNALPEPEPSGAILCDPEGDQNRLSCPE